jgi:hypothetical protein
MYKRRVVSLAKMTAMYLNRNLVKSKERTSNWEGDLNNKMVHCERHNVVTRRSGTNFTHQDAANDAHAALMVHLKLIDSAKAGHKEIDASKYTSSVDPHSVGDDKIIAPHVLPASNANFPPEPPRPQYLRAYNLWHHRHMPLDRMCDILKTGGRVEPLKESTVMSVTSLSPCFQMLNSDLNRSYVVGAIQADTSLPFDMGKLLELIRMEAGSWQRHRAWLIDAERSHRGRSAVQPE